MKPTILTLTLAPTADDDYVCLNQTPAGAVDLTLNGVGSTAKANTIAGTSVTTCVMDTNANCRQILFTSAGDESGKTITLYGRLSKYGPIVSEAITGPNTTAVSVNYFYEVTRVAVSAAFAGNVKVGTNAVGATQALPLDHQVAEFHVNQICSILSTAGTPNVTAQHATADVQDQTMTTVLPQWSDDATIAAKTAAVVTESALNAPVTAVRFKNNSGTGTATLTVIQSGP